MSLLVFQKALTGKGIVQTIFQTIVTNCAVTGMATMSAIVTARIFSVVGRGEFTAILFWSVFLSGLVSFGLPTSLIYNLKNKPNQATEYIKLCFMFQIPVSVIVGIMAWFFLPQWLHGFSHEVIETARWYSIMNIPLLLAIGVISAILQSVNKFYIYNGLRLYIPLFNLVGLLFLWSIGNLNIHVAALAYLITSIAVVIWALYKLRQELHIQWFKGIVGKSAAISLFGYGYRVYGVELLSTFYNQFDKIIILSLLTAKDLGLYTVVYALSRGFNAVQSAVTSVIFPKTTGLEKSKIYRVAGSAFRLSFFSMIILVFPSMFAGRFLMEILFGDQYLEASTTFYLLCLECVLSGSSGVLTSIFNAMGRPGLVLARQFTAVGVSIGLFYVFTPMFGLNGIAFALLVGGVVRLFFSVIAIVVMFNVPVHKVFFDKSDFVYLAERIKSKNFSHGKLEV